MANAKHTDRRGMALLLVVIFSAALAGFMMLMMLSLRNEHLAAENYVGLKSASDAADAGLEYAVAVLWDQYLNSLDKAQPATLAGYRKFLSTVLTGSGKEADVTGIAVAVAMTKEDLSVAGKGGANNLLGGVVDLASGATIDVVKVTRTDSAESTMLQVTSTGSANGRPRNAVQQFTVGGATFQSFDYAMMANNMECVMCHMVADNVERLNNTTSTNWGTYDRIKIGVLGKLALESTGNRTRIAGTVHSRGTLTGMKDMINTGPLTSLKMGAVQAYSFDTNGKILEDKKGSVSEEFFDFTGTDKQGLPLAKGTFYKNYPSTQAEMTDGYLPGSIPAVIPDSNGNRLVDDEEWKAHSGSAKAGSISGGLAFGVPKGGAYKQDALPAASNEAIKYLSTGKYDGNVILVGTDADPIRIDGDVFVDGDVVITGKVKGTGKIQARRNIYFAGNTTNADAGSFGTAKDGTQNLVGFAAGGNIMVGDFLTTAATNSEEYGKNKWTEYNREGDKKKKLAYLNPETIDQSPVLDKGDYVSFASQEMMKFNQDEYRKATTTKGYVPRYYQMRAGDRTYRFTHETEARAAQYESWLMSIMPDTDLKGRAVMNLSPDGGWMNEDTLKQIWWNDERGRDKDSGGGEGFKIDGLLYTNNAVMGFMPSSTRHKSNMHGSLRLRGAIFAGDLGLLATGTGDGGSSKGYGFNLQYDARVKKLLSVSDGTGLTLKRSVRLFETAEKTSEKKAEKK